MDFCMNPIVLFQQLKSSFFYSTHTPPQTDEAELMKGNQQQKKNNNKFQYITPVDESHHTHQSVN